MHDFKAIPMLSGGDIDKKPPELLREVGSQREVLNKITAEVDGVLVKHKCPRPRIVDAAKILEQMKKPRKCTADSISFTEEARQEMLEEKKAELSKALCWDSWKRFEEDLCKLKTRCAERLKLNDDTAKAIKSGSDRRRITGRVAKMKGVEVGELGAVKNITVDLPPEIPCLKHLYQQKFERQLGVVIDRSDAGKGFGKGAPVGQPKALIVHGVGTEADACAEDLRGLNLSEKRVVATTARQASAVMV